MAKNPSPQTPESPSEYETSLMLKSDPLSPEPKQHHVSQNFIPSLCSKLRFDCGTLHQPL